MIAIPDLYKKFLECTGVSTDTRSITPDCLFVALRGPSFNANSFALDALTKGARYAVVDDPAVAAQDPRCLLVADGLTALQDLARHHRQTLTIPVVGLTGSNGKTTTKELIAGVLSKKYALYATQGNLNNHIGVPLTVLSLNEQHELAVVEMGANHQQEIALLSSICQPTHGLITNVGKAHLEGFGGIEGVRIGKGELYDYLARTGGTVFVNASDPVLMDMYRQRQGFGNAVFYLENNQPELLSESPVVVYRTGTPDRAEGREVTTHLPGRYNFMNMAAALAIGEHFGVETDEAHHAIADYNPTNNRSQVVTKGTNTILLDAYNANPSSMAAAIQQFMQQPAQRKLVILGDMYELGDDSPAEHEALGELVAQGNFDVVILSGKDMKYALEHLPRAYYFPDKFSLHNWIIDHPMQNTHILIKGSRGMKLETVVPFI
ncbi:MAG: UDP-N-acetylmuramoyl-tripeptide--D-alanyl-D-alanine ligase [Cytophagales bacterium]|nr:MAG: UDP-N-acetylmuramoyl-tripeptide--D-alanyl-D-alanine ligase [Cytophagales bacterium]